jgi:hypothetical protein
VVSPSAIRNDEQLDAARSDRVRLRYYITNTFIITVCARAHGTLGHHSMTEPPADPVELARSVTKDVFEVLIDVLTHPEATHSNRLAAALALWERGWGKPTQPEDSRKADERPVSELTIDELFARAKAIIENPERGVRGADAGEAGSPDVRERDRDPGSAGSS